MTRDVAIAILKEMKPIQRRADNKSTTHILQTMALEMAIRALEQRWIPVTKRLPEDSGYYLTTTMFNEVYCDYWTGTSFDREEIVIAWMPLPESYMAESEEE